MYLSLYRLFSLAVSRDVRSATVYFDRPLKQWLDGKTKAFPAILVKLDAPRPDLG